MKAPNHFNETAIRYFDYVVEELEKIQKLDPTNQIIIERLAFNLATIEACEKELFQDGYTIMGPHGKKEHPSVGTAMKAQAKIIESFKLLGLDASHKFKEEQAKPEDLSDDPLLKILGRV
ncbi:P27 family phage terminase small subunit [Priestia megaterium]|uniref:P27 family phage terminase small subunit n=1 Tax=Priestia megaterium TaxID=1404 RepID=UPI0021C038A6|nr:P27 family phage terminase small subunit [Priestia megaterium]MCT9858225.1 P27 family phage terminase small subunit [Priestia megaterium]MDF1958472.1 P27 family phage terminase small subunit [Priestia megaterium]